MYLPVKSRNSCISRFPVLFKTSVFLIGPISGSVVFPEKVCFRKSQASFAKMPLWMVFESSRPTNRKIYIYNTLRSTTTVILAPGACRRRALSGTFCKGKVSVGEIGRCVRNWALCAMSSKRLVFVDKCITLELFVCIGVPPKAAEPC